MIELEETDNILLRPVYAWISSIDGAVNTSDWLPGASNKIYVRRAVAEWLRIAAESITEYSDYKLIVVDGFRNYRTQASGFSRLYEISIANWWWNPNAIATQYDAALQADGIFSFVDINMALVDDSLLQAWDCQGLANHLHPDTNPELLRKELLTAQANRALYSHLLWKTPEWPHGEYWTKKILKDGSDLFQFNNNAHTGGGAIDIFLGEKSVVDGIQKIIPVNHVPFDHMGPESAIDFLENPSNWERYKKTAKQKWPIQSYLESLDIKPDDISDVLFIKWRDAIRLLTSTMVWIGATYYYAENWHFNVPNIVVDPKNWKSIYKWTCVKIQTNTWNSCHAILTHGAQGIQTFTGNGAHEMLEIS